MKKVLLVILLIISIFSVSKIDVRADMLHANKRFDEPRIDFAIEQEAYTNCGDSNNGLFTQKGLDLISEVLGWVRILGPVFLILLVALDLGSAVMSSDNDALSKATKKIVPRMIGTGLLFFVPTIVRFVLNMDGVKQVIVINDDPLCGVMSAKEPDGNYDYI